VREHLAGDQQDQGLGRQQHLLERAVLLVAGKHLRHREHRGQQRADPDHARGDLAQHLRLGAHADRKQTRRDDEEAQRQQGLDAPPPGEQQVAPRDGQQHGAHGWACEARSNSR
jgi:hypothetical protein